MKRLKFIGFGVAATAVFVSSASAAAYFTDFTGYALGELNGQNGWSTNSPSPQVGSVLGLGVAPWGSRSGSIGFTSPVSTSPLYVSHGAAAPIVGPTNASFSSLFQVIDSDSGQGDPVFPGNGASVRDTFGFRLENSSGANLFSFILTPFSQSPTPELNTAFNTFSWSSDSVSGGTPTLVLPGVAAQEGFAYTFNVAFSDAGGGNVGFTADVNGSSFNGTLNGLSAETIGKFGAFWNVSNITDAGSNFMVFDNVSLVPEPSSALLGILGASCVFLRRRRA
jgi:hypothetical protein